MSAFSGPQFTGAMRVRRSDKREQAEARNRVAQAHPRICGHVHGRVNPCGGAA